MTIAPQELHNWHNLANAFGTGKFFFDQHRFGTTIQQIKHAFSAHVPSFLLSYSVKANYFSGVLQSVHASGVNFECASLHEINLALQEGIRPESITLNTPYLTPDLVKGCVQQHIIINADTLHHLEMIAAEATHQQKNVEIGIRFSFPQQEPSRFGIPATPENLQAISALLQLHTQLKLITLHTHFTDKNKRAEVLEKRAQAMVELYEAYFTTHHIRYINIGGGFAGSLPDELAVQLGYQSPGWEQYAAGIAQSFNRISNKAITLVIEPGMALVADAFYFLSEVVSIKKVGDKNLALLNTSTIFLKPTGHQKKLIMQVLNKNSSNEEHDYELVGITCREDDVLGHYTGNLVQGSLVVFKNIGAYTLSFRPDFIFAAPEIVTI